MKAVRQPTEEELQEYSRIIQESEFVDRFASDWDSMSEEDRMCKLFGVLLEAAFMTAGILSEIPELSMYSLSVLSGLINMQLIMLASLKMNDEDLFTIVVEKIGLDVDRLSQLTEKLIVDREEVKQGA